MKTIEVKRIYDLISVDFHLPKRMKKKKTNNETNEMKMRVIKDEKLKNLETVT